MVWVYVVIGLVAIIAILILMKSDSRAIRRRSVERTELITNVTYVCMHCGQTFQGSTCPKCGSDKRHAQFTDK